MKTRMIVNAVCVILFALFAIGAANAQTTPYAVGYDAGQDMRIANTEAQILKIIVKDCEQDQKILELGKLKEGTPKGEVRDMINEAITALAAKNKAALDALEKKLEGRIANLEKKVDDHVTAFNKVATQNQKEHFVFESRLDNTDKAVEALKGTRNALHLNAGFNMDHRQAMAGLFGLSLAMGLQDPANKIEFGAMVGPASDGVAVRADVAFMRDIGQYWDLGIGLAYMGVFHKDAGKVGTQMFYATPELIARLHLWSTHTCPKDGTSFAEKAGVSLFAKVGYGYQGVAGKDGDNTGSVVQGTVGISVDLGL